MKNIVMITALCAGLFCGIAKAEVARVAPTNVVLTFPELIYECHDLSYPCQLWVEEEDGTTFMFVKIGLEDPYVILPNKIMEFRGKGYLIEDVQALTPDSEDVQEFVPGCISVKMAPYEKYRNRFQ